jgi:hypothetical protein
VARSFPVQPIIQGRAREKAEALLTGPDYKFNRDEVVVCIVIAFCRQRGPHHHLSRDELGPVAARHFLLASQHPLQALRCWERSISRRLAVVKSSARVNARVSLDRDSLL